MANALPTLSPLWRNSLRTWLAATLTIGIMLWSGRSSVMMLGLLMAVLFINDNELTPLRSVGQLVGGALIGILTAIVLREFTNGWLVTAIGLLVTGCLVRGLGLVKGVGMGYMGCWSLEVVGAGKTFNWALIFNLAFTVVVGIAMAQLATWAFWPRPCSSCRPWRRASLRSSAIRSSECARGSSWAASLRRRCARKRCSRRSSPCSSCGISARARQHPSLCSSSAHAGPRAAVSGANSCASGCSWNRCCWNCRRRFRPKASCTAA
jgi:hypothetical protein